MATIRKSFSSPRSAEEVWAVLKRFEAVHKLAKGFVVATRMEPSGARVVTFANGREVREWLVSADNAERRLVYAVTDSPTFSHYSAAAQVVPEAEGCRFEWTVDFLPDETAEALDGVMSVGAKAMAAALA